MAAAFMYIHVSADFPHAKRAIYRFGTFSDVYMYFIKCIVIVTCLFKLDISGFVFDMFDMYTLMFQH